MNHKNKSFLIKQLRIVLLAIRGFDEDKCQLRASALTFYSLLSVVPVLAMLFGIAKGFGYDHTLEQQIRANFSDHEDVLNQVLTSLGIIYQRVKSGKVEKLEPSNQILTGI